MPDWVIVKVLPETLIAALRASGDVFGDTESLTVPAPLPELPETTVTHVALAEAVH